MSIYECKVRLMPKVKETITYALGSDKYDALFNAESSMYSMLEEDRADKYVTYEIVSCRPANVRI